MKAKAMRLQFCVVFLPMLILSVGVVLCATNEVVEDTPYVLSLNENHYLFVHGRLVKNAVIQWSSSTQELKINDFVIFPGEVRKKNVSSDTSVPESVKDMYAQVPFVKEYVEKNGDLSTAIKLCSEYEYAFGDSLSKYLHMYKDGHISEDKVQIAVNNLLTREPFSGICEHISFENTEFSFKLYSREALTRLISAPQNETLTTPEERALGWANRLVDFFKTAPWKTQVVIVAKSGNTVELAGPVARDALQQIEDAVNSGKFVEGPLRDYYIREFTTGE